MFKKINIILALLACGSAWAAAPQPTNLYWGDTHLRTKLSPDAYIMQNRSLGPDEAYRFAKGLPVVNAKTGHRVQIGTPLDFLVAADHYDVLHSY